MERGGVEYQCSETTLLENIREAQSKAKETPKLFLCSHARFYGKDLGDSGWGCGYRNAQVGLSACTAVVAVLVISFSSLWIAWSRTGSSVKIQSWWRVILAIALSIDCLS